MNRFLEVARSHRFYGLWVLAASTGMRREDGKPIYPDTITEQFNELVDHAGLPGIRLHDRRHCYATIAFRSGVHPKIVSTRLGYATVAFTLDVYSADVPDLDSQAAETISGLFLPPLEDPST